MNAFIHRRTVLAVATLLAVGCQPASPTATPSATSRPWRTPPWPPNRRSANPLRSVRPNSKRPRSAPAASGAPRPCSRSSGREVGRLRLQRRPRREPDVRSRLHRPHRPRRSDPGHVRPGRDHVRRPAEGLLADARPDDAQPAGHDVGTQYRSAVFYHTDEQRKVAEQYKQQLDASKTFARPIVTEITPFKKFYPAEKYHQNYFNANPSQSYCQFVIRPKVEKFNKEFKELLKEK